MTCSEIAQLLRLGSREEKLRAFDFLFSKASGVEGLDDGEVPLFEALKKELLARAPRVVQMSARVESVGGVKA